jgi:hypothetical protein
MEDFNFLRKKEINISNIIFAQQGFNIYLNIKNNYPNMTNIWEKVSTEDGTYIIEMLTLYSGRINFYPINTNMKVILIVERDSIVDLNIDYKL